MIIDRIMCNDTSSKIQFENSEEYIRKIWETHNLRIEKRRRNLNNIHHWAERPNQRRVEGYQNEQPNNQPRKIIKCKVYLI